LPPLLPSYPYNQITYTQTATMEWKKDNKTLQILTAAEKGGYGVVAPIA
jgi:hypothetical protein